MILCYIDCNGHSNHLQGACGLSDESLSKIMQDFEHLLNVKKFQNWRYQLALCSFCAATLWFCTISWQQVISNSVWRKMQCNAISTKTEKSIVLYFIAYELLCCDLSTWWLLSGSQLVCLAGSGRRGKILLINSS